MAQLKLRACPRCSGDILPGTDVYGDYQKCLQCGYLADKPRPTRASQRNKTARKTKRAA